MLNSQLGLKKYKAGAYLIPNAELFHYHIESNAENKKKQILIYVKECFMIFKKKIEDFQF